MKAYYFNGKDVITVDWVSKNTLNMQNSTDNSNNSIETNVSVNNLNNTPVTEQVNLPSNDSILNYLRTKQGDVTMKQIQSRFKNCKITCQKWTEILANLQFTVQGFSLPVSKRFVNV